ncbi:MAG: M23 family metallopeptidase [Gammaproteobacteria bacterium]|nr:M23 family metallopeptidase [Gammaproteobacteria bacterium]
MTHRIAIWLLALLAALASVAQASDRRTELPDSVSQGALVIGHAEPRNVVEFAGRRLRVAKDGTFAFGVARDEAGPVKVKVTWFDGAVEWINLAVTPRDWPIERIDGVPPATVNPPPAIAARIAREQAQVAAARSRDDARADFVQPFIWPVRGRISGRFGNQRIYMLPNGSGTPKSPHSGMDIAAANGAPVLAPAAGVVTFAAGDLYLTGGTVLLDHGHGISSNFLHLSRIDAERGDRVEQGQVLGAVGATGRATGPHLHWGMNWFDIRVDPLLVLEANRVAP